MAILRVVACLAAAALGLALGTSSVNVGDVGDDLDALKFSTTSTSMRDCPPPDPGDIDCSLLMEDFDVERYVGSWHVVYTTPGRQVDGCSTHVFSTVSSTLTYFEKDFNASAASYTSRQGKATVMGDARLLVISPAPAPGPVEESYWVVDTDYTTYSVVFSRVSMSGVGAALVLSRDYLLPGRVAGKVFVVLDKVLEQMHLSRDNLTAPNTADCIPDVCPPVGPTVQYLDAHQFAGRWHQQSITYRHAPQNALLWCASWLVSPAPNASLFLQREALAVRASMLQGQEQDDSERLPMLEARPQEFGADDGRYVIAERLDDGGRAYVRFEILGTDYNSWALVSICNSTSMSDHAVEMYTMMLTRNPVANSVPWLAIRDTLVLHDLVDDVTTNSTSSLTCPTPTCPDWIATKTPFEKDKFLGHWFVLEETPTSTATGFCSKHRLRVNNESLAEPVRLDMFQFRPPEAETDTLTYHLAQDISSVAKFSVTNLAPDGFRDAIANYWVLDTDYVNFAVTYSCTGARDVRVWVMSRTPSLSWAVMRHVLDVLAQARVDVRLLGPVDWPGFCVNAPDPDDSPCPEDPSRGARAALPSAVALAVAILVAVYGMARTPPGRKKK